MASDSLNEVGRFIGKTRKTADRSLKRAYPVQPRLERIRDIFDSDIAFEMSFNLDDQDERVMLDLFFQLPPPAGGCKSGCIFTNCESFDVTAGNHAVTVAHSYLPGSVSVYINNTKLNDSQIAETNPEGGEVFFQGGASDYTVDICYVYTDCPQDSSGICPYDLSASFAGAELIFSDRFDRAVSTETWGGLGNWYTNTLTYAPIAVPNAGGVLNFVPANTYDYVTENLQGFTSPLSETLVAVDLTNFFTQSQIIGIDNVFSLNGNGVYTLVLSTAAHQRNDIPDGNNGWEFTSMSQTGNVGTVNFRQKVFIRVYRVANNFIQFKLWPQSEPEPVNWTGQFVGDPENAHFSHTGFNEELDAVDLFLGNVSGVAFKLQGIMHWIGRNTTYGLYSDYYTDSTSWMYNTPGTNGPFDPGNAYFYSEIGSSITNGDAGSLTYFGGGHPSYPGNAYFYVSGFFNLPNPLVLMGTQQLAISWNGNYGKPGTYKISGEVRWRVGSASTNGPEALSIQLEGFHYGEGTPPQAGQWLLGDVKQVVYCPLDFANSVEAGAVNGSRRWQSYWVPFEITVEAASPNYALQWGARFVETAEQVRQMLVSASVDSILRRTGVGIEMRALKIEATMNPLSGARPLCPAGPLVDRCLQVTESFTNPAFYDYVCGLAGQAYQGDNGTWTLTPTFTTPRVTISGGKVLVNFKARGNTDDGSDGRCAYTGPLEVSGSTSSTNSRLSLRTAGPPACGNFSLFTQFKYGGIGPQFYDAGGFHNSPYFQLTFGSETDGILLVRRVGNEDNTDYNFIGPTFGGANSVTNFTQENVAYNLYIEETDATKVKIWRVGDAEPNSWTIQIPRTTTASDDIYIEVEYDNFNTDNAYAEIYGVTVKSLEAINV